MDSQIVQVTRTERVGDIEKSATIRYSLEGLNAKQAEEHTARMLHTLDVALQYRGGQGVDIKSTD